MKTENVIKALGWFTAIGFAYAIWLATQVV
jgi:hypothetical protein